MKDKDVIEYINPNTKELFNPYYTIFEIEDYSRENEKIIRLISLYTKQKEKSLSKYITNALIRYYDNMNFNDIKENDNNYEYIDSNGQVISF